MQSENEGQEQSDPRIALIHWSRPRSGLCPPDAIAGVFHTETYGRNQDDGSGKEGKNGDARRDLDALVEVRPPG